MICYSCKHIIDKNDLHLRCNANTPCYNNLHLSCFHKDNTGFKNVTPWICKECACKVDTDIDLSLDCARNERQDMNITLRKKQSSASPLNEDTNLTSAELPSLIRICKECTYEANFDGDNDLSLACAQREQRDANVTLRRKQSSASALNEDANLTSVELTSEIRYLRQEVSSLSDQLCQAISSITCYHEKLELYSNQLATMDEKLKQYADNKPTDVRIVDHPQTSSTGNAVTKLAPPKKGKKSKSVRQRAVSTNARASTLLSISEHNLQTQLAQTQPPQAPIVQVPLAPMQPGASSICNTIQSGQQESVITSHFKIIPTNKEEAESIIPNQQVQDDNGPWTEVKTRRSMRHASLCGSAGPAITTLKAVEPRKYMHLWNMESDAEEIRGYLRQLCPIGTCTVQELNPKGDYKSYKIGFPTAAYDACFSTEVWPVNARIKAWIPYKRPVDTANASTIRRTTATTTRNSQPFRGPSTA